MVSSGENQKDVFRLRRIHTSNWRGWQVHVKTLLDYETRRQTFALASAFLFDPCTVEDAAPVRWLVIWNSRLKESSVPYVYTVHLFISLFKYILHVRHSECGSGSGSISNLTKWERESDPDYVRSGNFGKETHMPEYTEEEYTEEVQRPNSWT